MGEKEDIDNIKEPKAEEQISKKKILIGAIIGVGIITLLIIVSSIVMNNFKNQKKPKKLEEHISERKKITDSKNTSYEGKNIFDKNNKNNKNNNNNHNSINSKKTIKEEQKKLTPEINEQLKLLQEQLLQEELSARKSTISFDEVQQNNTSNNNTIPTTNVNGITTPNFGQEDQNKIKEKKDFFNGKGEETSSIYNPYQLVKPVTKYQVNAGSIIPGIFITGVKSTLPGRMIGQVRTNVYDTTTGQFLLIPKGAKIIGMYDSNITFGQNRVMIVWERIIFPSGKSIQLNRFSGTDLSGYAGVTGKVNNHFGKLLTSVVLSSILGSATAITTNNDDNDDNNWRTAAGEGAGEQMINIGSKYADKLLNVAPEITISPGEKFNILVNSDLILEPVEE